MDTDISYTFNKLTNLIDDNNLLSNYLINNMFSKSITYKNSIFESYVNYNYDTVYAIGDIHCDYKALLKILKHINCIKKVENKTINPFTHKTEDL